MTALTGLRARGDEPWAYLITFACYGAHLHGDPRGSIDRRHNAWGGRYIPESPALVRYERGVQRAPTKSLDSQARAIVLSAVRESLADDGSDIHAIHVRSTHVHAVLQTSRRPEEAMGRMKAYASRALNDALGSQAKRWARHGSTIWLWNALEARSAVEYVVYRQGRPMAWYLNEQAWPEFARPAP